MLREAHIVAAETLQHMNLATTQPARHPKPTTRAKALAYLVFERPDLDRAVRFLSDFGLRTVARDAARGLVFLRANGPEAFCYVVRQAPLARFVGFGLEVDPSDLEGLSRIPGASRIDALDWPGGGRRVRLVDPSGFEVDAVCERAQAPRLPHREALRLNSSEAALRVNATQRPPVAPPDVLRLGHVALELADYQATCAWYTQHFGFIPSDVQALPDGSPAVTFMRLDLGTIPADHHTLALVQGFAPAYNHSAFEVLDLDAVAMGQRVLRERGYKHAWGLGRHILGSQIFDYWQDPWGAKHEHYCDGDLFTAEQPTGVHAASREAMAQWGQAMPRSFTKPRFTVATIVALVRSLRRSPDVTLSKLRTLSKLFG